MLRIAIVDPQDTTRDPLRSLLLGVDFVFLEAESNRYEFFPDVIRESPPDILVVSLDGDKPKALTLVGHLTHEFPDTPIVVISDDNQAILQALQGGANPSPAGPVVRGDLPVVPRKARGAAPPAGAEGGRGPPVLGARQCKVIAVLG